MIVVLLMIVIVIVIVVVIVVVVVVVVTLKCYVLLFIMLRIPVIVIVIVVMIVVMIVITIKLMMTLRSTTMLGMTTMMPSMPFMLLLRGKGAGSGTDNIVIVTHAPQRVVLKTNTHLCHQTHLGHSGGRLIIKLIIVIIVIVGLCFHAVSQPLFEFLIDFMIADGLVRLVVIHFVKRNAHDLHVEYVPDGQSEFHSGPTSPYEFERRGGGSIIIVMRMVIKTASNGGLNGLKGSRKMSVMISLESVFGRQGIIHNFSIAVIQLL